MAAVPPLVHVTGVTVIGDHSLRLPFEDGTIVRPDGGVDMAPEPLYEAARAHAVVRASDAD